MKNPGAAPAPQNGEFEMTVWSNLQDSANNSEWTGTSVEYTFLLEVVSGVTYNPPSYYFSGANWAAWYSAIVDTNPIYVPQGFSQDQKNAVFFLLENSASNKIQNSNQVNYTNEIYFRNSYPDIVDFTFTEVSQNSSGGAVGEITFMNALLLPPPDSQARAPAVTAKLPVNNGLNGNTNEKGDILINHTQSVNDASELKLGGSAFFNIMHEIAHAYGGLKDIKHTSLVSTEYDSEKYTITSYNSAEEMNDQNGDIVHAHTLQLLDIAAIQDTYGTRNYSTRSVNDSYTINAMNPSTSISDPFLYTIWDGGGDDTIDASALEIAAQIDLRQGRYSSLGYDIYGTEINWDSDFSLYDSDPGNVAIAYHTIIENATGTNNTSYGDILIGNDWSNDLRGLDGDDTLYGDGRVYDGSGGFSDVDIDNPDGEKPDFDNDILRGGIGADTAYGGYGHDILVGENTLLGLEGDSYHGGGYLGGPNLLNWYEINHVEDGSDTADYSAVENYGLTINLETGSASRTTGGDSTADTLVSIENVIGSTMADAITGTNDDNILVGLQGNDTFYASEGTDIYHGGYDLAEMLEEIHINKGDLPDLSRAADGTDTVNYLGMTDFFFDVTVLDLSKGNYWVDKYDGNAVYNGAWDRDTLFSIEDLQIDQYAKRESGGAIAAGDENNNNLHHNNFGGTGVARSYYGYGGDDDITGGNQNDLLVGGADNDDLFGEGGDDTYFYGLGDGRDFINDGGAVDDIDTIMFGEGILPSDIALGRYYSDWMTIKLSGNIIIDVDNQNYYSYGIDYIKFHDGTVWDMQGTVVPVYGTDDIDTLHGTHDTSYREGSHINDIIHAWDLNDKIYARTGDDIIWAGGGNDDPVQGEDGDDIIHGEAGNDKLYGGDGDDKLYGGAGTDTLNGGNGSDILNGEGGVDTMTGGGGADTFVFKSASAFSNVDTITDFKQSESDKLDISDILSGFYDYGVDVITDFVQITQSGATAYLSINQNGSGGGGYVQIATLTGLGSQNLTDEAALEASGRLITHV